MKAVSAVPILLLAIVAPAIPQDIELGARAGISLTWLGGDVDSDGRTSFAVGAFMGVSLTDWLAVYPELAFVGKGGKSASVSYSQNPETGDLLETFFTETIAVDYVQLGLPVAVTVPLSHAGKTLFRFYTGPFVGLRACCSTTSEEETRVVPTSGTDPGVVDCSDEQVYCAGMVYVCGWEYKNFDFGFVLGGGIDLGIGRGALTADVRYELGLTDISEGVGSIKTRALLLLIGYSHPFVLGNDS
jgi:hypothetical protein